MFEHLNVLPQDPILQLMQSFRDDPRPDKVDLGVGVYRDAAGNTPIMGAVHKAARRLLEHEKTKSYVGPAGSPGFNSAVTELLLGVGNPLSRDNRVSTIQTPGGCGALRMAAEFIKLCKPDAAVWVSTPTWANHMPLLGGAGLQIQSYPYLNSETLEVDFDDMMATLEMARKGDVVLLHGCCHNPSGADLTASQWAGITDLILRKELLPFVDMAYQGLGDGLEEDARGLRHLAQAAPEMLVAASCSKNFGLYRERTGALMLISGNAKSQKAANSQLLSIIRAHYSMPPAHGAGLVETILQDDELRREWQAELSGMRDRIQQLRHAFSRELAPSGDFDFIARQKGMFSFIGISEKQVNYLRAHHGIYLLESSRINIAGLSDKTLPRVAAAIREAVASA